MTKYPSEHQEQRSFLSWWKKHFTELLFAIPNGGKRGKVAAAKLKLEGVHAGVWDTFCPELKLWIEFKTQNKSTKLSPAQIEFGKRMKSAGYRTIAAWGCNDAIRQLKEGERKEWLHWSRCGYDEPEKVFEVR